MQSGEGPGGPLEAPPQAPVEARPHRKHRRKRRKKSSSRIVIPYYRWWHVLVAVAVGVIAVLLTLQILRPQPPADLP